MGTIDIVAITKLHPLTNIPVLEEKDLVSENDIKDICYAITTDNVKFDYDSNEYVGYVDNCTRGGYKFKFGISPLTTYAGFITPINCWIDRESRDIKIYFRLDSDLGTMVMICLTNYIYKNYKNEEGKWL